MPRGARDEYKRRLESAINACELIETQCAWILDESEYPTSQKPASWIKYAGMRAGSIKELLKNALEVVAGDD